MFWYLCSLQSCFTGESLCTNPSSSLSSCAAVAPPGWRLMIPVWIQLPLAGVTTLSLPWLQVLLAFKPLSGPAEWFIGALPCCPCSCLVEFLWTSPIFWSRAGTPFHSQTSDFSNNLSILRPTSVVKSLCKHKPQADLFKSLCNSCFPSACQTTWKDPLSVPGFLSISLFPSGACHAVTNPLKFAQIPPIYFIFPVKQVNTFWGYVWQICNYWWVIRFWVSRFDPALKGFLYLFFLIFSEIYVSFYTLIFYLLMY